MSQNENEPEAQNGTELGNTPENKPVHYPADQQDALLAGLVSQANTIGFHQSITLFVKGVVITGVLIGGRRFYELFGEAMDIVASQALKKVPDGTVANLYKEAGEKKYPFDKTGNEKSDDVSDPTFIHLEGARFLMGNGIFVPATGHFWRGRLNQIDGFMLGEMKSGPGE